VVLAQLGIVVERVRGMKERGPSYVTVKYGPIWPVVTDLYHRVAGVDFIHKVAGTFVTQVLIIGIGLVTTAIVARVLGPEGRGFYALATMIGAVGVQFGNLGLHASNTFYVAKNPNWLPSLAANSLAISLGVGGSGAVLVWIVMSVWPNLAPVTGLLLFLALMWIPFGLAYMLLQNLLLGIQEIKAYNKIVLISRLLGVGLLGVVIVLKVVRVEIVFGVKLVAQIYAFLWVLWHLRPFLCRRPVLSWTQFKGNISYGLKAYLAAFFSFLVLRVDLLIVKQMLGAEQAGYYSIAVNMADMVYMLPVVIGTILFPKLSAMSSTREKWEYARKVMLWVGMMMMGLGFVAAIVAAPTVKLLFGEAFLPAVPAFLWLIPAVIVLSINTVFMNFFASIGNPNIVIYSPGIAAVFNIALNIKLTPFLGIVGTSIASILAYGLMMSLSLVYLFFRRKQL